MGGALLAFNHINEFHRSWARASKCLCVPLNLLQWVHINTYSFFPSCWTVQNYQAADTTGALFSYHLSILLLPSSPSSRPFLDFWKPVLNVYEPGNVHTGVHKPLTSNFEPCLRQISTTCLLLFPIRLANYSFVWKTRPASVLSPLPIVLSPASFAQIM